MNHGGKHGNRRLPDDKRMELKEAIRNGEGHAQQLADRFGCSTMSVRDHANRLGIELPKAPMGKRGDDALVGRISDYLATAPEATTREVADAIGISQTHASNLMRALKDEPDTIPKEKRMATRKTVDEGGGQADDAEDPKDLRRLLDWHEQREKELLELTSILAARLVKQLERVEELEAAAQAES